VATDIGIKQSISIARSRALGQGRPALQQGPWKAGTPSQGSNCALHPRRSSIAPHRGDQRALPESRRPSRSTACTAPQREEVLLGLSAARSASTPCCRRARSGPRCTQTVMEGMFSDPIYGGNRDKAGWKLIGFPGAIAVHRDNIEK
jgi:gluconate 2-dehydrogenase gamma chain